MWQWDFSSWKRRRCKGIPCIFQCTFPNFGSLRFWKFQRAAANVWRLRRTSFAKFCWKSLSFWTQPHTDLL
jgi:hypothetical protein